MKAAKILIVEDEPEIAENLAALLNARGHSCGICSDSTEALALCRKEQPHLVLLDVMMPRLSGFDLCRLLRADPKTAKLRIVMVTGLGRMGDVEEAFRAGADDYLIKPFDAARLIMKVEKALASA